MSQIMQPKFRAPNKIYQCTKNRPLFIFKRGTSMFVDDDIPDINLQTNNVQGVAFSISASAYSSLNLLKKSPVVSPFSICKSIALTRLMYIGLVSTNISSTISHILFPPISLIPLTPSNFFLISRSQRLINMS